MTEPTPEPLAGRWVGVASEADFVLMLKAAEIANRTAGIDHVSHYTVNRCAVKFPIIDEDHTGYEILGVPPDTRRGTGPFRDEYYRLRTAQEGKLPAIEPELSAVAPIDPQLSLRQAQERTRQWFEAHSK